MAASSKKDTIIGWIYPPTPRDASHQDDMKHLHLCHGQASRVFLGMGDLPPLMKESLFHGYL